MKHPNSITFLSTQECPWGVSMYIICICKGITVIVTCCIPLIWQLQAHLMSFVGFPQLLSSDVVEMQKLWIQCYIIFHWVIMSMYVFARGTVTVACIVPLIWHLWVELITLFHFSRLFPSDVLEMQKLWIQYFANYLDQYVCHQIIQ
jgi:hypothetical protein